eukprot:310456_1
MSKNKASQTTVKDIYWEHMDDIEELIHEYEQEIEQIKNDFDDFTVSLHLGESTDECTDWFEEIPDEMLDFVTTLQNKITSVTIIFDPITKDYIDIDQQTTGSDTLDALFDILTNASNIKSLSIEFNTINWQDHYQQESTAINAYCNWIDYVFSFKNSWSEINYLFISFNLQFDDNTKILLKNVYDFIRNYALSLNELHLQLNSATVSCDLLKFWCPLLTSIKANTFINNLSIQFDALDSYGIEIMHKQGKSVDEISYITEQKTFTYLLILKKISSILYHSNIEKIVIDFDNKYGWMSRGATYVPMESPVFLLFDIINNQNINWIDFGAIHCKHLSKLDSIALNYCLKQLFSKWHIDTIKLDLYNFILSESEISNIFANNTISIKDLIIKNITIQPNQIGKLISNILRNTICLNYFHIVINALDIWKSGDKICRAQTFDIKKLFQIIIESIKSYTYQQTLNRYVQLINKYLMKHVSEQYIANIITCEYLLPDSRNKSTVNIEIVFSDPDLFQGIQKNENNIKDMLKSFETNYVDQQKKTLELSVKISQKAFFGSNQIKFTIPSQSKTSDNIGSFMFDGLMSAGHNMLMGQLHQL